MNGKKELNVNHGQIDCIEWDYDEIFWMCILNAYGKFMSGICIVKKKMVYGIKMLTLNDFEWLGMFEMVKITFESWMNWMHQIDGKMRLVINKFQFCLH